MKEKWFIACILLLCLVPSTGMLLPRTAETGGNEVLAAPPSLRDAGGRLNMDCLTQLGSYVEDNYFLRQRMVSAWSALNQTFLHTSIAANVVLGRDGWLYFGDTLNDYTGADPMSGREIFSAARNLWLMQEYCQGQGARFLFTAAPNKNSIYPEHMPELTVSRQPGNAERLLEELAVLRVPCADLFAPLRGASETLYFTQDSHWNSKGAALAADTIIREASAVPSGYFQRSFVPEANHLSDLYTMLYPTGSRLETDQRPEAELLFTYDAPFRSPRDMTIQTSAAGPDPIAESLVMFRDSFGELLYPYLADSYQNALFSRSMPYRLELAAQRDADLVVIELVERNLDYLIQNAPLMPAPERTVPPAEPADAVLSLEAEPAPSMPGYALVQGTLPLDPDDSSPVYLCAGDTCWEAFLLENHGFALYVPEDAPAGENVSVVFTAQDRAVCVPASASS